MVPDLPFPSRRDSRPGISWSVLLLAAGVALHGQSNAIPTYTYVDLGAVVTRDVPRLVGKGTAAWGINDSRVVVGDGDNEQVGWRYANGAATQTPTGVLAKAVNNTGVIIGSRFTQSGNTSGSEAIRLEGSTLQAVVTAAGKYAFPRAISAPGHIVGELSSSTTEASQGFIWYQGTTTLLGAATGYTKANSVNDAGEVVGEAVKAGSGDEKAFLWRNGAYTYLADSFSGYSTAVDINNSGVVVGTLTENNAPVVFKWSNGVLTKLAAHTGAIGNFLFPSAINDAGVVVGQGSSATDSAAMVWINDRPYDLNTLVTLPAGRTLASAEAINAGGDIVGYDNRGQAYLLIASAPAPVTNPGRLINLSVLTAVATPGDSFTLGYVVSGASAATPKPLVIRAAGPSLGALGVPGTLADPKLELFAGPTKSGENDDWGGASALASAMSAVGAFPYTGLTSRDAAVAANITTGGNSVIVKAGASAANGTGVVIAELYDATPASAFTASTPRLINVSVLKHIGTGLTAGFVIGGGSAKTVLVRAVGPGLTAFGVGGVVTDPRLELFDGASRSIGSNDNWGGTTALSAAFTAVGAFGLEATSKDAALVATLQPGSYSVQVSGVAGVTGSALVEVYEVP